MPAQYLGCLATLGGDADEQVLGGDIVVAELLGSLCGVGEDGQHLAVRLRGCDGGAGHAGQRGERPLRVGAHGGLVGAGGRQQIGHVLVVPALQQGQQQMYGGEVRVAVRDGAIGGRTDRVPAPVRQLGIHVCCLLPLTPALLLIAGSGTDSAHVHPADTQRPRSRAGAHGPAAPPQHAQAAHAQAEPHGQHAQSQHAQS
jgi:hypothetical protein